MVLGLLGVVSVVKGSSFGIGLESWYKLQDLITSAFKKNKSKTRLAFVYERENRIFVSLSLSYIV